MAATPSSNRIKAQLDEALQDIQGVRQTLKDAYRPEVTRSELVTAISEALDTLDHYDEDDPEDSDDD